MEYYSAIKRNNILIYVTINMNLENMLNEIRQKNSNTVQLHSYKLPTIGKFIETEIRIEFTGLLEGTMENYRLIGTKFLFRMRKFWK